MFLAASIKCIKQPGIRSLHVIGGNGRSRVLETCLVITRPIGVILAASGGRGGASHTIAQIVREVSGAAVTLVGVKPGGIIGNHVIGSIPVILTGFIPRGPIGIPLVTTSSGAGGTGRSSSHTSCMVPAVMLITTIGLGVEHVMSGIFNHVIRSITVTLAALITPLPIGIPQGPGTGIVEGAHAVLVIPGKVLRAAAVEGGEEPCRGILFHPGGLASVVETTRFETVRGLVGVEEVDGGGGRGRLRGRATGCF